MLRGLPRGGTFHNMYEPRKIAALIRGRVKRCNIYCAALRGDDRIR